MRRRGFAALLATALVAPRALAQQPGRVYRIGVLSLIARPPDGRDPFAPLRKALRERGWIEGSNVVFELRYADFMGERLPELAKGLVEQKVDVIVAMFNSPVMAAMNATKTIPIVSMGVNDPVKFGFAKTLARPGGNITGFSFEAGATIDTKSFELLAQAVPAAKRIAVLGVPAGRPRTYAEVLPPAAQALGVELLLFEAGTPEEIEGALGRIGTSRAHALFVPGFPHFLANRQRIAEFALKQRLPMGGPAQLFAEAGGLIGQGVDGNFLQIGAADYVDRLLRGSKPGELPFQQPTRYELVLNMKTARALGIAVPQAILLRADRVIE